MSGIPERIAAAEPTGSRPLQHLITRLAERGLLGAADVEAAAGRDADRAAAGAIEIRGISQDSRTIRPGSLFVAVPGMHVDGHAFVERAVQAGAAAVVVEHPSESGIPEVVVGDARRALAAAAAWWAGDPAQQLGVVGITGTDGKTTTSFLATAALESAGIRTGLISTVATRIGGTQELKAEHATTPEAPELQATLQAMVSAGDQAAVIETTSHALALQRVAEIAYDAAIFTNLSHEHLDLHGTYEAYRAAKLQLFASLGDATLAKAHPRPKVGIVNRDDKEATAFEAATREAGATLLTYGLAPTADVRGLDVIDDPAEGGLRFRARTPDWSGEIRLALNGRFNVHNALAALALGAGWNLDLDAVAAGLAGVTGVAGRMERVTRGQPFDVVIDYAHSPNGLTTVLDLLRPVAAARGGGVISVFGSAGERDTEKRPLMGRIAAERSRLVIVTDEDPRGEDRQAILEAIAAGAEAAGKRRGRDLELIADRAEAIRTAFERARPGDVVLLAGKGHERDILGPTGPEPWDERAAAEAALAEIGYSA
ncbi:MAG TPA: UDP-N-acetylmuramoyl-L-alanyl-D-glutamate--2,6-diaminopimelate ligase [Candidatus Eisenbacteria bacterium]|nr:UDP-N-acetylmuramoyl-L-alanyl-D-glutamate--2,6-diaminopimelate ligase [Candidatus Eisenbacteria bacterium]